MPQILIKRAKNGLQKRQRSQQPESTIFAILPADSLALGRGDRAGFNLSVQIAPERSLRFRAESVALFFRAKPLLRAFARARHRFLRAGYRPLHRNRNAKRSDLSAGTLTKYKFRRNPPPLRFGENGERKFHALRRVRNRRRARVKRDDDARNDIPGVVRVRVERLNS